MSVTTRRRLTHPTAVGVPSVGVPSVTAAALADAALAAVTFLVLVNLVLAPPSARVLGASPVLVRVVCVVCVVRVAAGRTRAAARASVRAPAHSPGASQLILERGRKDPKA